MKLYRFSAAMATALFLAACGGDDNGVGEPTGDPVSQSEAEEIGGEVAGQVLAATFGALFTGGLGPQAAPPVDVDINVSETVPCEGGGNQAVQVGIEGSFDSETGAGTLQFNVVSDPQDCVITVPNGDTFTINGAPDITLTGNFESDAQGEPVGTQTLQYRGGFSFESSDGRTGTCPFNVDISFTSTSASSSGTVCGRSFSETVTIGV